MREDGLLWRGAREKCHEFFSIFFSTFTDKDDIVMDWQSGVFFIFDFIDLISLHLDVVGGSVIACRSIQRHIVVFESDIDNFKALFLPMWNLSRNPLLGRLPHTQGPFLLLLLGRWRSAISICYVRKFIVCLNFFLLVICYFSLFMLFFSSCVFKVPQESPIHVLTADIFATPSTVFELPLYDAGFATNLRRRGPYLLLILAFSTNLFWIS